MDASDGNANSSALINSNANADTISFLGFGWLGNGTNDSDHQSRDLDRE